MADKVNLNLSCKRIVIVYEIGLKSDKANLAANNLNIYFCRRKINVKLVSDHKERYTAMADV
ncbi:hypothetical protein DLK05_12275 [Ancylomarina longa]|uniref:Uncharacterized protein n=1 Tax=Ancylomarina longa TaxID=2487017 RepID=A0A434AGQ3_9BACT|nr:hypothetical protein DLK05_12275 [Ancylomarina longa]